MELKLKDKLEEKVTREPDYRIVSRGTRTAPSRGTEGLYGPVSER